MGTQSRIEVTLFRRQTTLLYSSGQNTDSASQRLPGDDAEKPTQPFPMHDHDPTLGQNAVQEAGRIASLAQQIDDVLRQE